MFKSILSFFFLLFLCLGSYGQNTNLTLELTSAQAKERELLHNLGYKKNHPDLQSIKQTVDSVDQLLYRKGFLSFKKEKEQQEETLVYTYILGEPIRQVVLSNKNLDSSLQQRLGFTQDSIRFDFELLSAKLQQYTLKLDQEGLGMSALQLSNHNVQNNTLYCDLQLNLAQSRKLNDIAIQSSGKVPEKIIKQVTKRYLNKPYSDQLVSNLTETLNELDFLKQYKTPETLFTDDNTTLYLYLDKVNTNTFDGFMGFSTDENEKFTLAGYLDLALNNVLNKGETLQLYWRSDANKQTQFDFKTSFVYLFNTPLNLSGQLNIQKQDTIYQNTKLALQIGYAIQYNQNIKVGYQSTSSTTNSILPSMENFDSKFYTLNYTLIKKRSYLPLFPVNYSLDALVGTGSRTTEEEKESQYIIQLQANKNIELAPKHFFYINWTYYSLFSKDYLVNELYRFGGTQSLRGFQENSLLANQLNLINTEYRFLVHPSLYLHTIFDYAIQEYKPLNQKNTLYSIGMGLGFITSSSYFNLSFANGKQPGIPFSFDNTTIHIGFKTLF
ncbi:BamA/TamA family outer membrane protein [Myroides odoratus]|uniref:Outer membrane protein/protective antigen OMA87 n=1 Tax=Myroides odoratus TaxID=256 RepID=A0A9Q6Z7S1_MYROD|nr:hypothetical protein [Myroides odoratus]EHQ42055.1 hypothetical protein Myrod_1222 [Myroides odoratus DSM 2801]EKB09165.1 hypothetical protein HMPREF9716_00270 [Myroides odoratus CIP 103059]MDR0224084.1 hypothetical protein [Myroides odoratus]QQT99442.1 hypothetical protein I6I88_14815 [Myroides odoratus]WQD58354.1 hypothetical protein U0010_04145 [Myroides odoratus]